MYSNASQHILCLISDESGCESDMAEGCEETESNNSNAGTPAMLGTVLPCEAITAALGGMKREFDAISGGPGGGGSYSYSASSPTSSPPTTQQQKQQNQQPALFTSSNNDATVSSLNMATTASLSASSVNTITTATTTATISATTNVTSLVTKSPSSSSTSSVSGNMQHHPINLKSEDEDLETNHQKLNSSSPPNLMPDDKEFYKNLSNNNNNNNSNNRSLPENHEKAKAAAVAAAHAHLNGTMQDMINLQKLQNLATLQQQQQQQHLQHTSVPAALASLQGLAGISSAVALNSPLNLSVGSASTLSSSSVNPKLLTNSGILGGNECSSPNSGSQMPQLILASGQLVQGVQGAQLLIPTSQGISVQTVLTIPVSQQINTNEQFLQNYSALNSGGATVFNNMNLGGQIPSLASSSSSQTNLLKPNLFSTGVQQLLAALHPQLFTSQQMSSGTTVEQIQQSTHHGMSQSKHIQQLHKQQSQQINNHHHHQHHHHRENDESLSPKLELQQSQLHCEQSPTSVHLRSSPSSRSPDLRQQKQQQQQPQQQQQQHSKESPQHSVSIGFNLGHDKSTINPLTSSTPPNCSNSYTSSGSGSQIFRSHSPNGPQSSSSHSLSSQVNPNSSCVLSNINRLSNGEVTITKSLGPPNHSMTSGSTSSPSPRSIHQQQQHQQQQHHHSHHQTSSMKMSPTSMQQQISPPGTESSTADLLIDSPNELTINQTNCNVVDGIDLDEIKEFAKAFKLRRLSLGLTQTQVGQALSVTEGPAYSQSAICSALAAQMYAAQLSSQQQNMFEKLDITPKSAQKIKPVLERWMKEAEESHWNRYKSGQNHLTDFIGVEPSKKRKRRTSFTPQALELLNAHFERNTHPSGTEITGLAHQLGYEREVIRIWFCNKRQALKNTVRMMSKGMV